MSGFAAIFHLDGAPVQPWDLQPALERMVHRGPDDGGQWRQGPVGLGHCMLHTTPESLHEQLPLVWRDGALAITADARIDNRADLIHELNLAQRRAAAIADSELILATYQRWGDECPNHLLGDFAFAIWDARQQTMFCARDHFGVKPFYYYYAPGRVLACASEIEALLHIPGVQTQLNEFRVAAFLVGFTEEYTSTFYQDVLRLPPAHRLSVSPKHIRAQRYWALDTARELRLPSDQDYADAVREAYLRAVQRRIRSAYPVGSMLSGGLDSSSAACSARYLLAPQGKPLHTFSGVFPEVAKIDARIDERPFVDAVTQLDGVVPHVVMADQQRPFSDIPWVADTPSINPHLGMDWQIYRAARAVGVRTLLTGHDGDTIVSYGYEYFGWLARTGRWWALWRDVSVLKTRPDWQRRRFLWQFGVLPNVPDWLRARWRSLRHVHPPIFSVNGLIHPDVAAQFNLEQVVRDAQEFWNDTRDERDAHGKAITSPLGTWILEILDKLMLLNGVEPRHPFYDREFVELCVAMPHRQKFLGGMPRSHMRRAMHGILPAAVQQRRGKAQLSSNLNHALTRTDRQRFDALFATQLTRIAQYIDTPVVQRRYRNYLDGYDQSDETAFSLFLVGSLMTWFEQHSLLNNARAVHA